MGKNNSLVNVLITARGGSKRLPNKNKNNFCGKPLIAWTIEAALKSDYVNKVYVSTDNIEIAKISENFGGIIPRLRDKSLSEDDTSSFDTAIDFSEYFNEGDFGEMLLLQPTSPLRNETHINNLMKKVRANNLEQCVAVRDITKLITMSKVKIEKNERNFWK